MNTLYELLIEKGGLLGLVAVVTLIFTTLLLKYYRKTHHSDNVITVLIRTVRLVLVLVFSGAFLIQSGILKDLFQDSEPPATERVTRLISTDTISSLVEEKIFILDYKYRLHFSKNKKLSGIKEVAILFQDKSEIDTIFSAELKNVKKMIFYDFQNLLAIEYSDNVPSDIFKFSPDFKRSDFIFYINRLNKAGYSIAWEIHRTHVAPVIGFASILIALTLWFFLRFIKSEELGCMFIVVNILLLLIGISLIVFFYEFLGSYHHS